MSIEPEWVGMGVKRPRSVMRTQVTDGRYEFDLSDTDLTYNSQFGSALVPRDPGSVQWERPLWPGTWVGSGLATTCTPNAENPNNTEFDIHVDDHFNPRYSYQRFSQFIPKE